MSTNDAETTVLTKTPAASPSLDPINPYAVISLVAALLGLFPVAIVFGILAFTRPAGRGIAIAGLVLGVLELAALLLAFFGVASAFTDDSESSAAQTVTSSVYAPFTATDETPSTSAPGEPSPTATTDTNESTTEAEQVKSRPSMVRNTLPVVRVTRPPSVHGSPVLSAPGSVCGSM